MPYRRFLVWNVLGAIVWAAAMVTGGFLAGNSFRAVEQWLRRASLAGGVAVAVVLAAWAINRHVHGSAFSSPSAPFRLRSGCREDDAAITRQGGT